MRIGCVTTTIHVPRVLALYAKYGPDVRFFVVIDKKTPQEAINFCQYDIPNAQVVFLEDQAKWKCSELIGWNCIQRRSIGFLEALKWGAELVVSVDDDNCPLSGSYFTDFEKHFELDAVAIDYMGRSSPTKWKDIRFSGLKATAPSGWFDVGQLLQPKAEHRGFPYSKRTQPFFESITGAKVGVAAGVCLGDPDIGAVERIANGPTVHGVSELLRGGVVVDPKQTWTVFNSQNTAVVRELVPAWFMFPGVGRYDDIYASLVVQRVMRELGMVVHFGKPFVWQQRNEHDLIKDLKAEIEGMDRIVQISQWLNDTHVEPMSVIDMVRTFCTQSGLFSQAMSAWCDDCESVMK